MVERFPDLAVWQEKGAPALCQLGQDQDKEADCERHGLLHVPRLLVLINFFLVIGEIIILTVGKSSASIEVLVKGEERHHLSKQLRYKAETSGKKEYFKSIFENSSVKKKCLKFLLKNSSGKKEGFESLMSSEQVEGLLDSDDTSSDKSLSESAIEMKNWANTKAHKKLDLMAFFLDICPVPDE